MNYYAGVITYTDANQVQKTVSNSAFSDYCANQSIIMEENFRHHLSDIYTTGSMKRSVVYLTVNTKKYASRARGIAYECGVYGVKGGTPNVTRKTNYAQIFPGVDPKDPDFFRKVFGSKFLTGEETVSLTETEMLEHFQIGTREVSERIIDREKTAHVLARIWEAMEADPRTRFVIKVRNAQEDSLDLLRQIYLCLPQKLCRQIGFQTNIVDEDIGRIASDSSMAIHILTAEQSERIAAEGYAFPVVLCDPDVEAFPDNSKRIKTLLTFIDGMNTVTRTALNYAEQSLLEKNRTEVSSFSYYGEILEKVISGTFTWWHEEGLDSLEDVRRAYLSQEELMKDPEFHREALNAYYTKLLPHGGINRHLNDLLLDEDYPHRDELLTFAEVELGQGSQVKAELELVGSLREHEKEALAALEREYRTYIADTDGKLREANQTIDELKRTLSGFEQRSEQNFSNRVKREIRAVRKEERKVRTVLYVVCALCVAISVVFAVLWLRCRNQVIDPGKKVGGHPDYTQEADIKYLG